MEQLFIVRGLPGSGKTSLVYALYDILDHQVCTDDFMVYCEICRDDFDIDHRCISGHSDKGVYNFDANKLPEMHQRCQDSVEQQMELSTQRIFVHNTFSQRWEMEPYLEMAKTHNYRVFVIDMFDNGCTDEELVSRNSHNVPLEVIQKMRDRWEHDWKNGSLISP